MTQIQDQLDSLSANEALARLKALTNEPELVLRSTSIRALTIISSLLSSQLSLSQKQQTVDVLSNLATTAQT